MSLPRVLCCHYGRCGGCSYQHMPYGDQLELKERAVEELFGFCDPIIGCEEPWSWRNKMEFTFSQSLSGERFLGLLGKKGRGKVEHLQECHLAPTWMIEALEKTYEWWSSTPIPAFYPPKGLGTLRTLTLRAGVHTDERMAILTVSGLLTDEEKESWAAVLPGYTSLLLRTQHVARKQPTYFTEELLAGRDHIFEELFLADGSSIRCRLRAPSFFQPNTLQAQRIYREVAQGISQDDHVWDLYCGTGTMGMFVAKTGASVVGVETVPEAVEDAQYNLQLNHISTMTLRLEDAKHCFDVQPPPSVLIVDPPRVGLSDEVIAEIQRVAPPKMIYVSCNPASQKKNIDALVEYRIARIQPVDQFPHTRHLENIVFLEHKE